MPKPYGLICAAALLCGLMLAAGGCGGEDAASRDQAPARDDSPRPASPPLAAGLPALGTLDNAAAAQPHGTAGLTETLIMGQFTLLRSSGATDSGSALRLMAGAGSMEWGLYIFDPQGDAPDSVSVALDVDDDGSVAWVALADYSNGVWEWHGPLTAGKTFAIDEARYLSPGGQFYCAVASSDGDNATVNALSVRTINPANIAPVADLQAGTTSGDAPLQVTFDGGASSDSDGTIIEYAWDWNDDGLYDGISDQSFASHTFTEPGEWTVRLRVTDEQFARDSATVAISVNVTGNALPAASFTPDKLFADQGSTLNFDAGSSLDDIGIVKFEWDFNGDGQYESYGPVPYVSHTYSEFGVFQVLLRVTDTVGAQASTSIPVLINEVFELDGAWPGKGHDDRHTGRSPYVGSQTNSLKWDYTCGAGGVYSSPAIGADGTIYVGSHDAQLYAINPDGTLKWSYPTINDIYSSPAIGPDGTVYFGGFDGNITALKPDGGLKWVYVDGSTVPSSPMVGPDGIIYYGSPNNSIRALYPDGTLKWSFVTGGEVQSSPALGADGTIYAGCSDNKLYAITPGGTLKWAYTAAGQFRSSPAIGNDGTIYIGCEDDELYAVFPDGNLRWTFPTGNNVSSSPALGADGTIYVGSSDNKLYAIHPDGSQAWAYTAGGSIEGAPAIGADGTIYIGSFNNKINAIKPDGTLKWSYATGGLVLSSPAIGADGTVYAGCADNKLYAFGTPP